MIETDAVFIYQKIYSIICFITTITLKFQIFVKKKHIIYPYWKKKMDNKVLIRQLLNQITYEVMFI